MPYITRENRKNIDKLLTPILDNIGTFTDGEFNYIISKILWSHFDVNPSYTIINKIIGILECVKLEFYRRLAANLEDKKIKLNGDII